MPVNRTTSSIIAMAFWGLSSQRSQCGRQVKFLSKKSSLQVRLVKFNSGSMPIPAICEESMKEQKCQCAFSCRWQGMKFVSVLYRLSWHSSCVNCESTWHPISQFWLDRFSAHAVFGSSEWIRWKNVHSGLVSSGTTHLPKFYDPVVAFLRGSCANTALDTEAILEKDDKHSHFGGDRPRLE